MKETRVIAKVEDGKNPYRKGSFKHLLFDWALSQESFTKNDFHEAVMRLQEEHEVTSKMAGKVLSTAWWNEFKNKHETFIEA